MEGKNSKQEKRNSPVKMGEVRTNFATIEEGGETRIGRKGKSALRENVGARRRHLVLQMEGGE